MVEGFHVEFILYRKYSANLHHLSAEYVCPTCGKKGKHNHAKAPTSGNKPGKTHACEQCGARYATISGLKFHMLQKHKIGKLNI